MFFLPLCTDTAAKGRRCQCFLVYFTVAGFYKHEKPPERFVLGASKLSVFPKFLELILAIDYELKEFSPVFLYDVVSYKPTFSKTDGAFADLA